MVDDVQEQALVDRQVTATLRASATGRWSEVAIADPTEYRTRLDTWLESGEDPGSGAVAFDPDLARLFDMLGYRP